MHQISFELKRGHLRTVAWGEQALRGVGGMTAARFDLLYLLREKSILGGGEPLATGVAQRELWSRLDLDKSTISKMLTRLEEMGWVRRTRATARGDWRSKMVFVTALGLQRIAKAMRIMFRQRRLLSYFERIFKASTPWKHKHIVQSLLGVWETIHYIADCFGDRSIVCYDFGPQLAEGPWDFLDHRKRKDFHPLYAPPPTPRMPTTRKGPRQPCRPFEFTPYENAVREGLWGNAKRQRQRTEPPKIPSFTAPAPRSPDRTPSVILVELFGDPDEGARGIDRAVPRGLQADLSIAFRRASSAASTHFGTPEQISIPRCPTRPESEAVPRCVDV